MATIANSDRLSCVLIEIYYAIADLTHCQRNGDGAMPSEDVGELLQTLLRAKDLLEQA